MVQIMDTDIYINPKVYSKVLKLFFSYFTQYIFNVGDLHLTVLY